jgi:hypothetical protein
VVTLLRTVGYVQHEVDRPAATDEGKQRIDAAWKRLTDSKPNPAIFWGFIKDERNDVVHLYDPSARVNVTIPVGGVWWNIATGESGAEGTEPL